MGFAERAAARRKSKDLKNELKEMQKKILDAIGGDKGQIASEMKELQASIELGATLYADYEEARRHLKQAQDTIGKLLENMSVKPATEVQNVLRELLADLGQVYHECSIRKDDLDYQSTLRSLTQMVGEYSEHTVGMEKVMSCSELENVMAVLADALAWVAPDFLALAYYFLHEDGSTLHNMENQQRNQYVLKYFKDAFMDEVIGKCYRAGAEMQMRALLKEYIYG